MVTIIIPIISKDAQDPMIYVICPGVSYGGGLLGRLIWVGHRSGKIPDSTMYKLEDQFKLLDFFHTCFFIYEMGMMGMI